MSNFDKDDLEHEAKSKLALMTLNLKLDAEKQAIEAASVQTESMRLDNLEKSIKLEVDNPGIGIGNRKALAFSTLVAIPLIIAGVAVVWLLSLSVNQVEFAQLATWITTASLGYGSGMAVWWFKTYKE